MKQCPPDCPERHVKCHIDCERYHEYKEGLEREKKIRQSEIAVICYQVDRKNKTLRDKHAKKLFKRRIHHK